ncbi:MAG: hypothetical protein ACKPKO_47645, partial [Candidatus Fonsibacter sp.]
YIRRGIYRQLRCITVMLVHTNDPALTAVVATACRILGLFFPHSMRVPVEVTEERIDAGPEMRPVLEDLLTRIGDMWVHLAEFEEYLHNVMEQLLNHFSDSTSVWGAANTTR